MDLRPRLADNCCRSIYRRTSATELKTPRGIASQSAKSLLFNNIDRWVFRCAVVVGDPCRNLGLGVFEIEEQRLVQELVAHAAVEALDEGVLDRLARRNEVPVDAGVLAPGQHGVASELGAVVGDN